MEVDSRPSVSEHAAGLCKKAGDIHVHALSRLSKTFDVPTKLLIIQTFVLSQFNFYPTLCKFCKSCDTLKIEKLQ